MTLPRKGRRSISIDGIDYHYFIGLERSERAVIQRADNTGGSLFVFPFAIMRPVNVADAIRFAQEHAWNCAGSRTDCWLVFNSDEAGNSILEHLLPDDFRVVTYATKGKLPSNVDSNRYDDTRPWYLRPKPSSTTQKRDN